MVGVISTRGYFKCPRVGNRMFTLLWSDHLGLDGFEIVLVSMVPRSWPLDGFATIYFYVGVTLSFPSWLVKKLSQTYLKTYLPNRKKIALQIYFEFNVCYTRNFYFVGS